MQTDTGATPAAADNQAEAPTADAPPAPPATAPSAAELAEIAKAQAEGRLRHLIDQLFDLDSYLWLNDDVAAAARAPDFVPYRHYASSGIEEGRAPSVFFEIGYVGDYVKRIEQRDIAPRDLMAFYAEIPFPERFVPNRWFSPWAFRTRYGAQFPALHNLADYDLLAFYLSHQRQHALSPSGLFDEAGYRKLYPDVAARIQNREIACGFVHFITKGQAEGRAGIPGYGVGVAEPASLPSAASLLLGQVSAMRQVLWYFDEEFYLSVYRDAYALKRQGRVRSGLEHFVVAGCAEGRLPHPLLLAVLRDDEPCDGWSFLARMAARQPPVKRTIGMAAACAARDLIAAQPGAAGRAEISAALWRFIERPAVRSRVDAVRYFNVNPDLTHALKGDAQAAQLHWETYGFFEGRRAPGTNMFSGRGAGAGKIEAPGTNARDLRHGVNFFGPLSSRSGPGDAARGYVAAFRAAGIPIECHDISVMLHGELPGDLFHDKALPYAINFLLLNADQVIGFVRKYGGDFLAGRFNVAAWVWELPAPLPVWRNALAAFDLIVAPSRFAAESFALFTETPVEVVPYALDQAALRNAAAGGGYVHWGARLQQEKEAGKRIVLFVMDAPSGGAAKGLDLFEKLAGHCDLNQPGRYLFVLKTSSRDDSPSDAARATGRHLLVIDGLLEFSELCYLKSLADVYISPHRGEGFGLNIFESLLLGVPALCSGFAGPVDLLGPDYPFLIPGGLTELGRESGPYRAGSVWFEPDFELLLERFLALFEAPAADLQPVIERLAAALSPGAVGARLRAALELHGGYLHGEAGAAPARVPPEAEIYSFDTPERNGQKLVGLSELVAQSGKPFFSVITATHDANPTWLWQLYEDLVMQSFPFWEWCIADDGSTRPETLKTLRELRRRDARVQVHFGGVEAGLPAATNRAVLTATGAYLVMIGQADRVSRELLKTYRTWLGAETAGAEKTGVMIYCDEDKVDDAGKYSDTYFKPDRSPEHLMSCMYMLHCLCVRKQVFLELGGYRSEYAGSEEHDFALRVAASGTPIWHVDACLYHWRLESGAAATVARGIAAEHGRLAVLDHCRRIGLAATVEHGLIPGTYRPRPQLPEEPVCINIFTGCARIAGLARPQTYVERFVRSILQQRPAQPFRLRIIVELDRAGEIAHLEALSPDLEVVPYAWNTGAFNFAEKVNFAVQTESSARIVLLNDDMLAIDDTWLGALLEMLEIPGVGVVGGRLLREDDTLQHAGIVLGVGGASAHIFANAPRAAVGYNAFPQVIRNYSAVTGAMLAFRRSTFDLAGGFDESFPVDYSDVDFCLKVGEAGLRTVYTPFASLIHYEARSARRFAPDELDTSRFVRRWPGKVARDPFYNVNLTRSGLLCEPREG